MFDAVENIDNALETWYENLDRLVDVLSTDPTSATRVGTILNSVIQNVTVPVGNALVVLCFFIGLFGAASSMVEAKRPEVVVKLFVRTAIAGTLVSDGYNFVRKLLNIFQALVTDFTSLYSVTGAGSSAQKVPEDIKTAINSLNFMEKIPITIIGLLGSIAITVCSFIVLLTVYGRVIKIYMYMVVAPIPLATFAGRSTQQVAIQFLRNFCAVGFEGIIMILAIWIYGYMQRDVLNSALTSYDPTASAGSMVWSYLQTTIFNILILITIIKTSNAIGKEMFGV